MTVNIILKKKRKNAANVRNIMVKLLLFQFNLQEWKKIFLVSQNIQKFTKSIKYILFMAYYNYTAGYLAFRSEKLEG